MACPNYNSAKKICMYLFDKYKDEKDREALANASSQYSSFCSCSSAGYSNCTHYAEQMRKTKN